MLVTIVILLGICHRGERKIKDLEIDIYSLCAILISFVALIVTVIDRKFKIVSTESEYRKEILLWYNRCIENLKLLEIVESSKKNELLAELSAFIEETYSSRCTVYCCLEYLLPLGFPSTFSAYSRRMKHGFP